MFALLAAIPTTTIVVVATHQWHDLFWRSLTVVVVDGASVLVPTVGPWYWLNLAYLYAITLAGLGLFGRVVVRSGTIYRRQAAFVFVGAAVPLAANAVTNLGTSVGLDVLGPGPMVDLTTTAFTVTGVAVALAVFHFDLLTVRPIARDRLVEELDDGVVVVGPNDRGRDLNTTAAEILERVDDAGQAGQELPPDVFPDGDEFVAEVDGSERRFRVRSTPLPGGRARAVGRVIYLNDVTDVVEREQRISVLNRVRRHNVRNELNVVRGHLEMLDPTGEDAEHVAAALESTERVVGFAEKTRHVERTLQTGESTTVGAVPVVRRVVESVGGDHPNATIEARVETDGPAPVRTADDELFEMAVTELVENAIEHSDRVAPTVTVRVTAEDGTVEVHVADDGPGIADQERTALGARTEGHIEHSSGLGLWLVKWTASLSGGELSFGENDPRGSIVTVSLPAAD